MRSLSPIEKKIYEYIKKTVSERGYSPSIRDIQNELLIKSTSTVHFHLKHLEEYGYIYRENGKSRAIALNCDIDDLKNRIPVLGHIGNGTLPDPEKNFDGYIYFSVPQNYKRDEIFAIRISNTISKPECLRDGDTLIVSKSESFLDGDMVVALKNGNISIQKTYKDTKKQNADNILDSSDDISYKILGKVIASLRFY